jgi:hypothetical protein
MWRYAGRAFALAILASSNAIAPAQAASCGEDIQKLAAQYRLSLAPAGNASPPGSEHAGAEAPATTESRGLVSGADSLASSGGTLPPDRTEGASNPAQGGAPAKTLGAADRAKVEGLLSEARAAEREGHGDLCRQHLQDAETLIRGAGG